VGDYQYEPGNSTVARDATVDPAGNLYVAGSMLVSPPGSAGGGLIRKSTDGGRNWSDPPSAVFTPFAFTAITSDAGGNLYAGGTTGTAPRRWLVRRSQDAGLTWSTVDDFVPGGSTSFHDLAADSAGNVYTVGGTLGTTTNRWLVRRGVTRPDGTISWSLVDGFNPGHGANGWGVFCHPTAGLFTVGQALYTVTNHQAISAELRWVVRRSRDGGASWTTVDSLLNATAIRGGADAAGNLYVVGNTLCGAQYPHSSPSVWLVRKSSNGGDTWTTVDSFAPGEPQQGFGALPKDFAADAQGNLFVAGYLGSTAGSQWVVRENPGGTGSWRTVDTFQLAAGSGGTQATAVAANSAGQVFVVGYGYDTANTSHWIVRELSTPQQVWVHRRPEDGSVAGPRAGAF
jgi:hypothetical protein